MKAMIQAGLLSIVMLSGFSYAANLPKETYGTESCGLGNVYEDIDCYDKDNQRLINELNGLYRQLQQADELPGNDYGIKKADYIEAFTVSQVAWQNYVDSNCAMLGLANGGLQGGGVSLAHKACWHKAYQQRVNELTQWLQAIQVNQDVED